MDNYNYPLGSDTKYAPWNREDPKLKEFSVTVSQTLSKETSVETDDYVAYEGYLDSEDGGGSVLEYDTKDTDWKSAYNTEHLTPLQLISELKRIVMQKMTEPMGKSELAKLKWLKEECDNWVEDDLEIIGNE